MMSVAGYEFAGQYKNTNNVVMETAPDGTGRHAKRSLPSHSGIGNESCHGTIGACLYGCLLQCKYQPTFVNTLRDSGLSLYPPIPRRQRQDVAAALTFAAVQERF